MSPIANMLSQIVNAQMAQKDQVVIPFSKMSFRIASLLKSSGFVEDISRWKKKSKKVEHEYLEIKLRYIDGRPAISGTKMVSKPSRRMYVKSTDLRPVRSGYGLGIISTPKGLLDSKSARKENVGGEIICEIW